MVEELCRSWKNSARPYRRIYKKQTMKKLFRAVVLGAVVAALAGCGGGGGGDDDSSSAPPVVHGFTLTATLAGKAVTNFNVSNGQSGAIKMDSGQELVVTSTSPVTWVQSSGSGPAVTATDLKPETDTQVDVTLASVQGDAVLIYTVTSKEDASLTATVTIAITQQQFNPVPPVLGATSSLLETDTYVNGTTSTMTVGRHTTFVSPDGSASTDGLNSSGVVTDHYTLDPNGNRLSRTYADNGNLCSYNPSREYLNFPMSLGKSWTSTWQYSCVAGYHEMANLTATVEAWEPVTVPAGTFNALRVRLNTTLTNSNDTALTNGSTGAATYSIALLAWYVPEKGSYVKYQSTYSYVGFQPPTYIVTQVQSLQ
jgi:hypothetical protein